MSTVLDAPRMPAEHPPQKRSPGYFPPSRRGPSVAFCEERLNNRARRIAEGRAAPSLEEWLRTEFIPIRGSATNFTLTLDTTAPAAVALTLNSGAAYATSRAVTAGISTSDGTTTGYTMKLWGNVDTTVNANIQATQGASSFITYSATQAVTLSTGDGSKTVSLIVQDAVGNVSSTATATITLDTTAPVPNITVAASPTTISKVAGFDTTTFTWQSDTPYQAYEVAVVSSTGSARGTGTVIATTNGSTNVSGTPGVATPGAAATNVVSTIKGGDLQVASAADGAKIVKIFVQDVAGNWSV